jgi:glycosyltransferase involved in cell wall biosynthesis
MLNNQGLAGIGGGVTIVKELAGALSADHRIVVISLDSPAANWPSVCQRTLPPLPELRPVMWRFRPLQRAWHYRRCLAKIAGQPPDLAVVFDCQFVWAVRALRPRHVVYVSLSCIPRQEWFERARSGRVAGFLQYMYLERAMVATADVTVVSSETHAREMRRYELLPRFRPTVVHPVMGSVSAEHRPETDPGRKIVIATVGRLTAVKNVDAVLDLAERLTDLPCRFVIAGDGGEADRLRGAIGARGLSERVSMLGNVSDIGGLLTQTDVLLHPSRYESFGIAVFEAMRAGIPVVCAAPRSGGMTAMHEFVANGRSGLLVDFSDADGAARALRLLVTDGVRRRSMGEEARAAARALLRRDYIHTFRDLLDTLGEARPP